MNDTPLESTHEHWTPTIVDGTTAMTALKQAADGLRRHNTLDTPEGDINLTRQMWFEAANRMLASRMLTKQQQKELKNLKMSVLTSSKKK